MTQNVFRQESISMFLMLFVFSALLTGYLVLGKPIMMYVDGQKKEAVRLLFYTGAVLLDTTNIKPSPKLALLAVALMGLSVLMLAMKCGA